MSEATWCAGLRDACFPAARRLGALLIVGWLTAPATLAIAEPSGRDQHGGGTVASEGGRPLRLLPPPDNASPVALAQFSQPLSVPPSAPGRNGADSPAPPGLLAEELPPGGVVDEEVYPIDLPSALRLAGANNLQIALAAERVNQAAARAAAANVLWIPTLSAGVVYNHHSGRIQATEGEVIDASRSSLFVGGGVVTGSSPAAGGGGNPRMFVDLSLADAIFQPLAARQLVRATAAQRSATFNDTLLQVSATYYHLVRAQARVAIAEEAVRNAEELARITRDFAETGLGLQADADRAQVEAASRQRDVHQAREELAVVSAELARLLRLAPTVRLQAADHTPARLELVDPATPVKILIDQAVAARPELRGADAQRDAALVSRRQEQLRPWMPHLYAGFSGGGFGGGEGSHIGNFGGRADFDVAALWEFQNLGFGNVARQREEQSLHRQSNLMMQQVRDRVAAEVAQSHQRVQQRQRQIDVTQPQLASAQQALQLNLEGIRGFVLRPIEIQQAIGALASARTQYLDAVIDYNVAQLEMLRAIGRPPAVAVDGDRP